MTRSGFADLPLHGGRVPPWLAARIDNNAVADGFQIYLHSFVLTRDGEWAIVQQGMNEASRLARRDPQHEHELSDFASLLLLEQLGPRTLQSLALVAEAVHGTATRFADPARFSFAHGGKDGHPFPVPLTVYDESLGFLRRALDAAKLGRTEKLDGFARLDTFARAIEERLSPDADVDAAIAHERALSPSLGGRTVFDGAKARAGRPRRGSSQLELFPPHER